MSYREPEGALCVCPPPVHAHDAHDSCVYCPAELQEQMMGCWTHSCSSCVVSRCVLQQCLHPDLEGAAPSRRRPLPWGVGSGHEGPQQHRVQGSSQTLSFCSSVTFHLIWDQMKSHLVSRSQTCQIKRYSHNLELLMRRGLQLLKDSYVIMLCVGWGGVVKSMSDTHQRLFLCMSC